MVPRCSPAAAAASVMVAPLARALATRAWRGVSIDGVEGSETGGDIFLQEQ